MHRELCRRCSPVRSRRALERRTAFGHAGNRRSPSRPAARCASLASNAKRSRESRRVRKATSVTVRDSGRTQWASIWPIGRLWQNEDWGLFASARRLSPTQHGTPRDVGPHSFMLTGVRWQDLPPYTRSLRVLGSGSEHGTDSRTRNLSHGTYCKQSTYSGRMVGRDNFVGLGPFRVPSVQLGRSVVCVADRRA
jgi:hypothetical protein